MRKLVIGIDIDNVICNTTEALIEYLNERFPVHLKVTDITNYWIENFLPEQFKWAVPHAFKDKEMWKKVKPIEGAIEGVEHLYDRYEIYFVTSSLVENLRKKTKFLQRIFPFMSKDYISSHLINIHNKQLLNLDILIDDYLDNLIGERTYYSICLDYPWNDCPKRRYLEETDLNFICRKDWAHIIPIIDTKACLLN